MRTKSTGLSPLISETLVEHTNVDPLAKRRSWYKPVSEDDRNYEDSEKRWHIAVAFPARSFSFYIFTGSQRGRGPTIRFHPDYPESDDCPED